MTKPTGRPRGRPKKHRASVAPLAPHRPRLTIVSDPDRFRLALMLALMTRGRTQKDASEIVAFGKQAELVGLGWAQENLPPKVLAQLRPRWRTEMIAQVHLKNWSSIRNRGKDLAKKLKRYLQDPATHRWLTIMGTAMLIMSEERDERKKAKLLADIPGLDNALSGRVEFSPSLFQGTFSPKNS